MKELLSSTDWQELSAYIDHRLSAEARIRLEKRLEKEPALRSALQDLRFNKSVLRSQPRFRAPRNFTLTPDMVGPQPKPFLFPTLKFAAAFASIVLVFLLVGDFLSQQAALAPAPMAQQAQIAQPEAPSALSKAAPYPGQQAGEETSTTEGLAQVFSAPAQASLPTNILPEATQAIGKGGSKGEAPPAALPKIGEAYYTETPRIRPTQPEVTLPAPGLAQVGGTPTGQLPMAAAPMISTNTPTGEVSLMSEIGIADTAAVTDSSLPSQTPTPTGTLTATPTITSTLEVTPTPLITPTLTLTPTPTITVTQPLNLLSAPTPTQPPLFLMLTPPNTPTFTPTATAKSIQTRVPKKKPTKTPRPTETPSPTETLEVFSIQATEIPTDTAFPSATFAPDMQVKAPGEPTVAVIGEPTESYPTSPLAAENVVEQPQIQPTVFGVARDQWRGLEILAAIVALCAGLAWLLLRQRY